MPEYSSVAVWGEGAVFKNFGHVELLYGGLDSKVSIYNYGTIGSSSPEDIYIRAGADNTLVNTGTIGSADVSLSLTTGNYDVGYGANHITNHGDIFGDVDLSGPADTILKNTGTIHGETSITGKLINHGDIHSLNVDGAHAVLLNYGTVGVDGGELILAGSSGIVLRNEGVIANSASNGSAITDRGEAGFERNTIINTGEIQGNLGLYSTEGTKIINDGLIKGSVFFWSGDDVYIEGENAAINGHLDTIGGAEGDDFISVRSNYAFVYGGPGKDILSSSGEGGFLFGEAGDDILRLVGGSYRAWGGDGNDHIVFTGRATGSAGLRGDDGDDIIINRSTDGFEVVMMGGAGNDLMVEKATVSIKDGIASGNATTKVYYEGNQADYEVLAIAPDQVQGHQTAPTSWNSSIWSSSLIPSIMRR